MVVPRELGELENGVFHEVVLLGGGCELQVKISR